MGRQREREHQQPTTTMERVIVIAASLAMVWTAPQFLTDTIRSSCRSEVTTVFEETETETVNKVICQTEFREECTTKVAEVCRNVTTGVQECQNIEKFECVDSITNKCGIEKVLKNVSYTETVCRNKLENICEKEFVGGEARPVEGSCATKPTEVCEEMTRFQEEFVDEDRCRDIPIKDCKNVQSEVCNEKTESVCEPEHTEDCQIVPHEECEHIVEKIPKKVSKKITKVVCDESDEEEEEEKPTEIAEDESANADDNANDILNNIFEIFGISNNGENEIEDEKPELVPVITTTEFMIDDGLLSESTTKTTTTSTTHPTTTTTTSTTSTTTTTLRTSTVKDLENIPTEPVRRMDGSKIIFSDQELEARNKDLANRVYLNVVPTRPTTTESVPTTSEDPHSRIFFPE